MTAWRDDIRWGTPLTDAELDGGHGCRKLHSGCMCRVGFTLDAQCGWCVGVNAGDDGRRSDRCECQTLLGRDAALAPDAESTLARIIGERAAGTVANGWRWSGKRWEPNMVTTQHKGYSVTSWVGKR